MFGIGAIELTVLVVFVLLVLGGLAVGILAERRSNANLAICPHCRSVIPRHVALCPQCGKSVAG
jgi:hypothetical protein